MSLMYDSKNDTILTLDQLHDVKTPAPRGRFHQPYPFAEFVDEIKHSMGLIGIKAEHEEYAIQKDGQRFFGLMSLAPDLEGEYISSSDWALTLGVRGAHDQSIPRGIALGSQVLVCSNLCFSGNLGVFRTKQTLNISSRLPQLIRDAVNNIPGQAAKQRDIYDTYKGFEMKPRWGDAALVEMHRRNALSSSQLGHAIKEWDSPSYKEHAENGYTAWRLLNACTQALKPTGDNANMNVIQDRSMRVSSFINEIAGI